MVLNALLLLAQLQLPGALELAVDGAELARIE